MPSTQTIPFATTPGHRRRTQLLVLIAIATQVAGNVFLSHGMRQAGPIVSASPFDYLRAINPWTVAGVCALAIWMVTDLALLSRADLSFVLPVIASSYVLIAIAGHFVLGERISGPRWIGILVISFGVLLAETTPDRTTRRQGESL
jgi:bacterial/archaeal transporter family protein